MKTHRITRLRWTAWLFWLGLCFLALSAARCSQYAVNMDSSANAAEAGDATVIIEGCGSQPVVGYTYCRFEEGLNAETTTLTLHAPPVICDRESCIDVQIFFPDGSPSLGFSIPRGETKATVLMSDLIKRKEFTKQDRGFWPVLLTIRYIGPDGERLTFAEGEIRLRVLSKNYVPLHEIRDSAEYAWRWRSKEGQLFRMSTSGRAYTGKSR